MAGSKNIFKLAVSVTAPLLAGGLGAMFTAQAIPEWYEGITRPSFSPPDWVFGPVWTTLYIMMGISVFLVWKRGLAEPGVKKALLAFIVQLILNAIWTPVFFGMRSPLGGLIVIVFLWLAIILTIIRFMKVSKLAGGLLVPYLLWVSFATVLNAAILILNS